MSKLLLGTSQLILLYLVVEFCFIRGIGIFDFTLVEQTSKCSKVGLVVGDVFKQKTPITLLFCVEPKAN